MGNMRHAIRGSDYGDGERPLGQQGAKPSSLLTGKGTYSLALHGCGLDIHSPIRFVEGG